MPASGENSFARTENGSLVKSYDPVFPASARNAFLGSTTCAWIAPHRSANGRSTRDSPLSAAASYAKKRRRCPTIFFFFPLSSAPLAAGAGMSSTTISPSRSVALCVCGTGPFTTLWFAGNRIWTRRIANFRSIRYVPSRISSNRYRVPSAFHVTW